MISVSWTEFKSFVDAKGISIQYIDIGDVYRIKAYNGYFNLDSTITKDGGADHLEFEDNYKANGNKEPINIVTTQEEKNDKVLKLACGMVEFSGGEAIISVKVPTGGRWAAGGYCFVDNWTMGDKVSKVRVVDNDNIFGYGSGAVLKEYYDSECDTENQGWFMYPAHAGSGEIEIDPIGGYGFLPEGLYLEVHCLSASSLKVCCDIWWGKEE